MDLRVAVFGSEAQPQGEGCRRLWVLVNGLPSDAATWRDERWSSTDELLASLIEHQDMWFRLLAQPYYKRLPKQIRVPRPGEEPQRREVTNDPREIAAFLARHFKQ